jgi:hypothetical protein
MLEQYRKTFLGVQALSFGATAWVYFGVAHSWAPAALVFLAMQVGGVVGAMWGSSLRRRMLQRNPLLGVNR